MHDVNFSGKLCQKIRLFHRTVSPSDNHQLLPPKEKSVTCGAGGDAVPCEPGFILQSDLDGGGACCDDHGSCFDCSFMVHRDFQRPCAKLHGADVTGQKIRTEPL